MIEHALTEIYNEKGSMPQFMGIFCPKCHAPAHWTQLDRHRYIMDKICSNCGAEMPKIEKIKLLIKN